MITPFGDAAEALGLADPTTATRACPLRGPGVLRHCQLVARAVSVESPLPTQSGARLDSETCHDTKQRSCHDGPPA